MKRLDLLYGELEHDSTLTLTVVELKVEKAGVNALGQVMGYMGRLWTCICFAGLRVRRLNGLIVAPKLDMRLIEACSVPGRQIDAWQIDRYGKWHGEAERYEAGMFADAENYKDNIKDMILTVFPDHKPFTP